MSKLVGMEQYHSEASERLEDFAKEREERKAEKQAAFHADSQGAIKELQKVSKVSPERFNEIIEKYGTGDYARSLITKTPYKKDNSKNKAGLW